MQNAEHRLDSDDVAHELDAVESETRSILPGSTTTRGLGTIRRLPHSLRSRSTRLYRRHEAPPLSQVLQLAAQAIATQLSGHTDGATTLGRPLGGTGFGGNIEDFVHTLQEAASAQAGENLDINTPEGELPPVNFMRVFQFPNDENGSPRAAQRPWHAGMGDNDNPDLLSDPDRSVTLVLVGVRSMPPSSETVGEGAIGAGLDNILNLSPFPPATGFGNAGTGALLRRAAGRHRVHPRRHSMTNFDFPAQYESQRHHRPRMSSVGPSTDPLSSISSISESPPGPHPPPSTPADVRSGHATPIRRPSSASAIVPGPLPDLEEDLPHASATSSPQSDNTAARQRQRSDSEFARRPELGAGAARRNGVVEPDHASTAVGRSWLIYVVGTNVSPDHPAFTMPSLFTDNPSYEDMQMLTTLLGPVKPPVASRDDVQSSGGVYRLVLRGEMLGVESVDGIDDAAVDLRVGERCLICLCDYEVRDEIRQLSKCQHCFHRECIDEVSQILTSSECSRLTSSQWLTTGRNSCPMCRAQGVDERNPSVAPSNDALTGEPLNTGPSVELP
jgi:hypothetical protein